MHGVQQSSVDAVPVERLFPRVSEGRALKQGDEKNRDVDNQSKEQQHIERIAKPSSAEGKDPLV